MSLTHAWSRSTSLRPAGTLLGKSTASHCRVVLTTGPCVAAATRGRCGTPRGSLTWVRRRYSAWPARRRGTTPRDASRRAASSSVTPAGASALSIRKASHAASPGAGGRPHGP
eukprot:4224670-Prymnesium_polylepis.3